MANRMIILAKDLDCYRPRSEGDNVLGSVRPSVRLSDRPFVCQFVQPLLPEPFTSQRCLSVCQLACADYCAEAVDRLLIRKRLYTRMSSGNDQNIVVSRPGGVFINGYPDQQTQHNLFTNTLI